MRNLSDVFERRTIDFEKLLDFGFTHHKDEYLYEREIGDGNFKVIVEISKAKASSKVIDSSSLDEYVLVDVKNATGKFVGNIKTEYEKVLSTIIDECTTPNVFTSPQTKKIIEYVKNKYEDDLEFLWDKLPSVAVWRNKNNNKWYGLLMIIKKSNLGGKTDDLIEIIDLRYPKESIDTIVDDACIFRGYHMNKKSWITIKLDGSVDTEKVCALIDQSYEISLKK